MARATLTFKGRCGGDGKRHQNQPEQSAAFHRHVVGYEPRHLSGHVIFVGGRYTTPSARIGDTCIQPRLAKAVSKAANGDVRGINSVARADAAAVTVLDNVTLNACEALGDTTTVQGDTISVNSGAAARFAKTVS